MKRYAVLMLVLLLPGAMACAQSVTRDELVARIGTSYLQAAVLSADSPLFDNILLQAKSANPGASAEQWRQVKAEVVPAITGLLAGKGSPIEKLLQQSLAGMSDQELQRLLELLNDPVYRKFTAAMTSPAAQKELLGALAVASLRFNQIINAALQHQGLKDIH